MSTAWQNLDDAARALTEVSKEAIEELVGVPHAPALAQQLLENVNGLNLLVARGFHAIGEQRARELKELVDVKSAFLRLAAHELRRPIALANGYLSLLQEGSFGPIPERMAAGLRHIEAGVEEMARLVEGLAALARAEDRSDAVERSTCDLERLVADAADAVKFQADAKRIHIEQQVARPGIEASVDGNLLRIAVINLLGNAVKSAPDDSVVNVTVAIASGEVCIAISDHGPGIDPADAELLFEPWQRGAESATPGLGLGLYIVRQIADLHGGHVTVDSTPGNGAVFTMTLPV